MRCPNGPTSMMDRMRADPAFRDVTSDSQNRGLQASLRIDRDKANLLGVQIGDMRNALYDAFGERQVSTIYSSANSYLVILEAADADRRFEEGLSKINLRGKNGALVPLSAFAHGRAHRRADGGQPPGPVAGDHDLLQPRARHAAGRRHRARSTSSRAS